MSRYRAILADPPWQFDAWDGPQLPTSKRSAVGATDYPMLSDSDLAQLPVGDLADSDCALFLWATMPKLDVAIEVGKAWGFAYKTCGFNWLKVNDNAIDVWFNRPMSTDVWRSGMGYWTNSNSELVLLFTRGKPQRIARDVKQIIVAPVTRHSAKPEEVQDRIERLVAGPYLELFARRQRPGWTCMGNEIDGLDIRDAIAKEAAT